MSALVLETAHLRHARCLSARLRLADQQEVSSASGRGGFQALVGGLMASDKAWAVVEQATGLTVLMFGIGPTERKNSGCPWMLASDLITKYPTTIGRHTRRLIQDMHRLYPVLRNSVDKRNQLHVAWLKWAGFQFYGESRGVDGAAFLDFIRVQDV